MSDNNPQNGSDSPEEDNNIENDKQTTLEETQTKSNVKRRKTTPQYKQKTPKKNVKTTQKSKITNKRQQKITTRSKKNEPSTSTQNLDTQNTRPVEEIPEWFRTYLDIQKQEKEASEQRWQQKLEYLQNMIVTITANNNLQANVPNTVDTVAQISTPHTENLDITLPVTASNVTSNDTDLKQLLWGMVQQGIALPDKPKFMGTPKENPVIFLNVLQTYGKTLFLDDERMLKLAQECLKGSAKPWTAIFKDSWRTFDDFKRDFLATYWTLNKQREVRLRICNNKYEPRDGQSMLAYFSSYVNQAYMLQPRIPDDELLSELVRHFSPNIQIQWIGRQDKSIKTFAQFLIEQESITQNKGYNDTRKQPSTKTNNAHLAKKPFVLNKSSSRFSSFNKSNNRDDKPTSSSTTNFNKKEKRTFTKTN